jgi:CRISPR/Cas system CMR subunit Cmr4 (Cas7 group RAMP superfamily)
MSTLHLSDSQIEDYVAKFVQLAPQVQRVLLNRLTETVQENGTAPENIPEKVFLYEKTADPTGVEEARRLFGVWGGEENRNDVEQMLKAIAENRMLEREVIL